MDDTSINNVGSGPDWPIQLQEKKDENGKTVYIEDSSGVKVPAVGWYPITTSKLIKQNIQTIVDTQVGFMLRNELFGTRVQEVLEEQNTQTSAFLVKKYVTDAVAKWESRVKLTKVESSINGSSLAIRLHYTINNTNQADTLTTEYTV